MVLFSHDPMHNDDKVYEMEAEARKEFPACRAGYEGLEIEF